MTKPIEGSDTVRRTEDYTESAVQKRLEVLFEGGHATCPAGTIDILSHMYGKVIEIKRVRNFRDAIGQLLEYMEYYKDYTAVVYFFGSKEEMANAPWDRITDLFERLHIEILRDDVDYARLVREKDARSSCDGAFIEERALNRHLDTPEHHERCEKIRRIDRKQMTSVYRKLNVLYEFIQKAGEMDDMLFSLGLINLRTSVTDTFHRFVEVNQITVSAEQIALVFFDKEIKIQPGSSTSFVDYDERLKSWLRTSGYTVHYAAMRDSLLVIFSKHKFTQRMQKGGRVWEGFTLVHPIEGPESGRRQPEVPRVSFNVEVPVDVSDDDSDEETPTPSS